METTEAKTVDVAEPTTDAESVAAPKADATALPDMTREEARKAIELFKVKSMGKEYEVDKAELIKGWSHQKAANEKMQNGLKIQRQAEEFISMLRDKSKLFGVLKDLGHDTRALAEEYLGEQLQEDMLDPRDKELKQYKKRIAEVEAQEKERSEQQRSEKNNELKKKYAEDYHKTFVEAIESEKLPVAKATIQDMARVIHRASELGYKMEAKDAAKIVKEDMMNRHRSIIGESDGEALMKILGEDVANKIRKWDTSRIKDPNQNATTPVNQSLKDPKKREDRHKQMTHTEWRDFNRKR